MNLSSESTMTLTSRTYQFLQRQLSQEKIPGLGPKSLITLAEHSIETLAQLLITVPLRYRLKNTLSSVEDFEDGQDYCVHGLIVGVQNRGKITKIKVQDTQANLFTVTLFHFSKWHQARFSLGTRLEIWGQARFYQGFWEMTHPELDVISQDNTFTPRVECVYPKMGKVSSKALQKAFSSLWQRQDFTNAPEPLGQILQALRILHAADLAESETQQFSHYLERAQEKISYLEALHYFSHLHQKEFHVRKKGEHLAPGTCYHQLYQNLPFQLTQGQNDVLKEILQGFEKGDLQPRLIQGDVGSGKTIVGFLALCCALDNNEQGALMAPTELLARQHYENILKLLPQYQEKIIFLSGSLSSKEKKALYDKIQLTPNLLIIGTHALFQEAVIFHSLRVIIIDEQQRFGVDQRAKLLSKSAENLAYQITLSATPIPRTLAMATYGPIHLNILQGKPAGRQDIKTYTLPSHQMELVYKSVQNCIQSSQQCYWVCPLITESEHVQAQNVEQAYHRLQERLPHLSIEVIHGQVPIDHREEILKKFKEGQVDILVSTLVIEVGVDSPTASLMVIESPDRLGLSQLHQLRGRVGRGNLPGHCILVYDNQLSETAIERLKALCQSQDGFYLSDVDLQIRGPGEVLGTRQTGVAQFKFFNLAQSEDKIPALLEHCQDLCDEQREILEQLFGVSDQNLYV